MALASALPAEVAGAATGTCYGIRGSSDKSLGSVNVPSQCQSKRPARCSRKKLARCVSHPCYRPARWSAKLSSCGAGLASSSLALHHTASCLKGSSHLGTARQVHNSFGRQCHCDMPRLCCLLHRVKCSQQCCSDSSGGNPVFRVKAHGWVPSALTPLRRFKICTCGQNHSSRSPTERPGSHRFEAKKAEDHSEEMKRESANAGTIQAPCGPDQSLNRTEKNSLLDPQPTPSSGPFVDKKNLQGEGSPSVPGGPPVPGTGLGPSLPGTRPPGPPVPGTGLPGRRASWSPGYRQDENRGKRTPIHRDVGRLIDNAVAFVMPREKGDLRDVILVCLSFSVLVYLSQKLVCVYFAMHYYGM
ncbi:hypothetical protein CBR_g39845 [Chara braunii]|uniref:Uncharacterized protein n=1 Tax=Chara braunii TaxID=69332 RepID=A0A388LSJ0_CHABU|nr:hypothetical protein CBR_g39845 [Chara braunii]|eukprot:GBG85277.1 hypothetical protein CBR_g39845 [Chara braunii]